MAEAAPKKSEPKESAPPATAADKKNDAAKPAGGGVMKSTGAMLGIVMILEAAVLFAGFKFLGGGGPTVVQGADLIKEGSHGDSAAGTGKSDGHGGATAEGGSKKVAELEVVRFKPLNRQSGRTILFDLQIVVTVKPDNQEKVKTAIADRSGEIRDRIREIVARNDPEKMSGAAEPGLETLRRQVKCELDEIIGEGMIEKVLVPNCTPYPTGN